jgi:hypothetical protein
MRWAWKINFLRPLRSFGQLTFEHLNGAARIGIDYRKNSVRPFDHFSAALGVCSAQFCPRNQSRQRLFLLLA